MYSMFRRFLQISVIIFPGLDAVVKECLLFWWHDLWIVVALEAVHLCIWRRAGRSSLGAVMNTVAEVDHKTWITEQEILLSSLKSDYIFGLVLKHTHTKWRHEWSPCWTALVKAKESKLSISNEVYEKQTISNLGINIIFITIRSV